MAGKYEIAAIHAARTIDETNKRKRLDETNANARLISAAPDLLQACQCMVDAWGQCECVDKSKPNHCPWCIARAAIAKAEGKTP